MSNTTTIPEQTTDTEILDKENIVSEVITELPPAEPIPIPLRRKPHIPITHRTWAKILVFLLTILMMAVTALSAVAAVFLWNEGIYTTPKSEIHSKSFRNLTENIAYHVLYFVAEGYEGEAVDYLQHKNVACIEIKAEGEDGFLWEYNADLNIPREAYESKWYWYKNGSITSTLYTNSSNPLRHIVYVTVYVPTVLTAQDDFLLAEFVIDAMYAIRYWIYAIAAASLLLSILCFIFLMRASGWRRGLDTPQSGWGTRIPFDLLTAALCFVLFFLLQFSVEASYSFSMLEEVVVWTVCGILAAVLSLGWCMSAALRVKLGKWWENTVLLQVLSIALRLLKRTLRFTGRAFTTCGRMLVPILEAVPLVWKTAAVCTVILLAEILSFALFHYDADMLFFTWFPLQGAVFAFVLYIAFLLRRLQKGGEALAAGDLGYQVDTKWMLPVFKAYAENLSRIGEGMTTAVEQRMKSERMKTELITNVSHDIKTPLTSIINYSDLIEKEPCENAKITEYAAVLHRQSERLKRLIEDLVEASKASTGNLDVQLAPCEVGVMLSQTVGEYEQRLEQCQLTLVTRQPEQPVRIMADGRRLWRVFDNLMNNICKYAMPGTRDTTAQFVSSANT